jgi:hypothetical protein
MPRKSGNVSRCRGSVRNLLCRADGAHPGANPDTDRTLTVHGNNDQLGRREGKGISGDRLYL